uniref:NADH-ubiquinone oxidoreductase chain 4L n=1 Tax=Carybdea alata TaxID=1193083 RepID=G9IBY5_CARAL|nr:NADH dehydrogenase subunit 4L [Alatina alata]AEP83107.1 NADH dehydrogenase subunit 4L [Alatina alata]
MSLGFTLFLIALLGIIINRTNLILMIMCLELLLLAVSLLFVIISSLNGLLDGQVAVIFILTVAACESALGLTIMVSYYRITGHISIRLLNLLKG